MEVKITTKTFFKSIKALVAFLVDVKQICVLGIRFNMEKTGFGTGKNYPQNC